MSQPKGLKEQNIKKIGILTNNLDNMCKRTIAALPNVDSLSGLKSPKLFLEYPPILSLSSSISAIFVAFILVLLHIEDIA